jgi:hypothetical protein
VGVFDGRKKLSRPKNELKTSLPPQSLAATWFNQLIHAQISTKSQALHASIILNHKKKALGQSDA